MTDRPMAREDEGGAAGYAWATLLVAGSTLVALLGRDVFHLPDVVMLYLLAIMLASYRFGRGPSLAVVALSVAAYDFLFVPPYYTFGVEAARHVLTFAMMFGLGLVISNLTAQLRQEGRAARLQEGRAAALNALSSAMVGVSDAADAARVAAREAAGVFGAEARVLLREPDGNLVGPQPEAPSAPLGAEEIGVARWASDHLQIAGAGSGILPSSAVTCIPLAAAITSLGVLVLRRPDPAALAGAHRVFLEVFARQVAFGIERVRLAEQARAAAVQARTEAMRSSLLSAVSHDLRTPLATITGAGTALRDAGERLDAGQRAELVETVCAEAERMERLIGNILDMVRIESGGMELRREWVPLEEVLGSALVRLDARLRGREVRTDLPEGLPLVSVDPVLFEQVFVNLLENALKYTPAGTPIAVRARRVAGVMEVEVADRGPGITAGLEERVFGRFQRGTQEKGGGTGLGLAICRGIVEAHGGTIVAGNREGGGAVFLIRLPLPGLAPPTGLTAPEEPRT